MKQVTGNEQLTEADPVDIVQYEWRKKDGEPPRAYNYFRLYLKQDQPRSLLRLAKEVNKHQSQMLTLSAKYKWVNRAEAYDEYRDGKQLEKMRRKREKADLRWLERRDIQREAEWQIAQDFLEHVRTMLRVPLIRTTVEERLANIDPDGRIIVNQIIINEPVDWSATDMVRFFEIAGKMARLATGMDTDRKKIKIDVSSMSDEELDRLLTEG